MPTPTPTMRGIILAGTTALGIGAVLLTNPSGDLGIAAESSDADNPASATTTPSDTATEETAHEGNGNGNGDGDGEGYGANSSEESTDSADDSTEDSAEDTAASGTYTGDTVSTPYGDMQVEITVEDGTITDIEWVQLPSDGKSQQINDYAAPTLVQEGLEAQSADVDSVSGASYTSAAFKSSLQSALDQAGL